MPLEANVYTKCPLAQVWIVAVCSGKCAVEVVWIRVVEVDEVLTCKVETDILDTYLQCVEPSLRQRVSNGQTVEGDLGCADAPD